MRVLIFHGYLLRGTGSNVYNASIARALARLGHEVHLLCQERDADSLPWVDSIGGGGREGEITVHVPEIDGLLPVYVADRYEGFAVKTFPELTEPELERYLAANVAAVRAVSAPGVDAALANHLVMGPVILARAGLGKAAGGPGFATKVHGSALEFTVKPNPRRFLPFAREGIDAASGVLVGSRHTAESLWEALADPALPARTRLGPPGVDTDLFAPLERAAAPAALGELASALRATPAGAGAFARDPTEAAGAVEHLAGAAGARVAFVGKLIETKGVDLLLAAWPLVHSVRPGTRLLIAGFGSGRERLERLATALGRGEMAAARELAAGGSGEQRLRMLADFLAAVPDSYAEAARAAAGSVSFSGRLEHEEVGRLVPACDAMVVPSTFPEAFGMVAAEAAAAGVLPICAAHSGLEEVTRSLEPELAPAVSPLLSFALGDDAIVAIADRLQAWLGLPEGQRNAARRVLSRRAGELWSWEGVARGIVLASAGRLDDLAPVPGS